MGVEGFTRGDKGLPNERIIDSQKCKDVQMQFPKGDERFPKVGERFTKGVKGFPETVYSRGTGGDSIGGIF